MPTPWLGPSLAYLVARVELEHVNNALASAATVRLIDVLAPSDDGWRDVLGQRVDRVDRELSTSKVWPYGRECKRSVGTAAFSECVRVGRMGGAN